MNDQEQSGAEGARRECLTAYSAAKKRGFDEPPEKEHQRLIACARSLADIQERERLVARIAVLLGVNENCAREPVSQVHGPQEYFSIQELSRRWRCSRGTVYNRLRRVGAQVLDFAARGKKGKKVVALKTVLQIELRWTKRLC